MYTSGIRAPWFLVCLFTAALAFAQGAQAEVSERDVQVAARAIALLSTKPTGEQSTSIVYDKSNAASAAEAEALSAILSASNGTGKIKFGTPKLVDISALSDMGGTSIAFLTSGLSGKYNDIAAAAAASSVLTVSSDLDCARQGLCVLGIQSEPKVEMLISKQAASQTGKEFLSTLLMLAKEV